MIFRRLFIFAFTVIAPLQSAEITQTDRATAQWLSNLFTLEQGQLLIAKKPFDSLSKARFPFAGQTEIQLVGRDQIVVNQDSLHPLSIQNDYEHLTIRLYTPMYDFLDEYLPPDDLPSRVPHPKDSAMTTAGYRAIATHIHSHLTKITGELPEHHRTLDTIGYASESYTWKIQDLYFYLWAYDGNDSDGIWFRISRSASDLHGSRAKPHTTKELYKDWGAPLPHRPSKDLLPISDEKDSEKAKRD